VIKLKRMRWTVHVTHMGEEKYRILIGIMEQKRQCEKPRHRWKDNITIDLKELRWEGTTGQIWLKTGTSDRLL